MYKFLKYEELETRVKVYSSQSQSRNENARGSNLFAIAPIMQIEARRDANERRPAS